jgi:hypothetical protein
LVVQTFDSQHTSGALGNAWRLTIATASRTNNTPPQKTKVCVNFTGVLSDRVLVGSFASGSSRRREKRKFPQTFGRHDNHELLFIGPDEQLVDKLASETPQMKVKK